MARIPHPPEANRHLPQRRKIAHQTPLLGITIEVSGPQSRVAVLDPQYQLARERAHRTGVGQRVAEDVGVAGVREDELVGCVEDGERLGVEGAGDAEELGREGAVEGRGREVDA